MVSRPCARCRKVKRCTFTREADGRITYVCRPCLSRAARLTRTHGAGVNRSATLSAAMQDVLVACASSTDGIVSVDELITRRVSGGAALLVARASLSRTLRRLWRAGLVELTGAPYRPTPDGGGFAAPRATAEKYRAMADSADEYRRVRRSRLKMGFEPPNDRAAYRAEYLARSARPEVRAQYVLITDRGRLTVGPARKLTGRKNEKSGVNTKPGAR
jgi:hypothetical protein